MPRPPVNARPTSFLISPRNTTWPNPGPAMRAAIINMANAAIVVWLMPTTMVRFAIGNWTVRRICHRVAPSERLASVEASFTWRMPNAVSRMTGGIA